MRSPVVRRVARIAAFVVPTVAAMTLAACGNPLGPNEPQPQRAWSDSLSTARHALQLLDSTVPPPDTGSRGVYPPWW